MMGKQGLMFKADVCDLCGSTSALQLIGTTTQRALRSDRIIVHAPLTKWVCTCCGLVRSGGGTIDAEYYTSQYEQHAGEHVFYTPQGARTRSQMLADWMIALTGEYRWQRAQACLEVGAGEGHLLDVFQRRFPHSVFVGVEPGIEAAATAQSRGIRVYQGTVQDIPDRLYDIAYSVAVIEHVPSPSAFLQDISARLKPDGLLVLCQPTQDVPSYDIFFTDHLHHFGSAHLRAYAQKHGFQELGFIVGHEWMPNFSLHIWQKTVQESSFAWVGSPAPTTCKETLARVQGDMQRLDERLAHLNTQQRPIAVFGLSEVFALTLAYSTLHQQTIACGLDDRPENFMHLDFPVVKPEACMVADVLLTMNKVYYSQAQTRLMNLGLTPYPVLS